MSSTAVPQELIVTRTSSRALLEVGVAIAVFAASLALITHGGVGPVTSGTRALDPVGVALAALATLPVIGWRLFPLGAFVLTLAAGLLLVGFGYRVDLLLGPAAVLYFMAASRKAETPWTRRTTTIVLAGLLAYLAAAAVVQQAVPASELLHTGLAWAVAWFAGERTRLRREQIADLEAHAVRAKRDAERDRQLAVAEERARIARDLHDSAGHAINVIAVRAGAARLRHAQEPARSLLALAEIEEVARQTAADIDQIVGTLREGGPATAAVEAPSGLASLDTLVGRHREAGLEVTLDISGTPRRLGTAVDQAAHRILQEALTNAARHGAGTASVELVYADDRLEVTVTNPMSEHRSPTSAGGHGLIGMRERATLLGGSLDAALADGLFRVRAYLPYGGQPV
jgi:signal transduction histidine kinase